MGAPLTLDNLRVATPCHASWEAMKGDERARFCGECRKHVYNLSAMSRAEATSLLAERGETLCVRFYQRADGTVLTGDCPVGVRLIRRRMRLALASVCAALFSLVSSRLVGGAVIERVASGSVPARVMEEQTRVARRLPVIGDVIEALSPSRPLRMGVTMVQGSPAFTTAVGPPGAPPGP
jgi:hypothetical protein